MKDKKIKGNRISNAYLFVNLVLIVVLLIGLWTKTSVWEAKLDLGGVILLLIIINTLLLFKEIIVGIAPKSEKTTHTKPKSLNALRAIIRLIRKQDAIICTNNLKSIICLYFWLFGVYCLHGLEIIEKDA